MRARRERSSLPRVALAGYTNAGKSTLLNALTGAEVGVGDRLFHTLDPTTRSFELSGRDYLLTDTVGFIEKLPHQLVEAFKATLEETVLADLILHVVDAAAPEERRLADMRAVDEVLEEIGAGEKPRLLVLNKADLLDEEERQEAVLAPPRRGARLRPGGRRAWSELRGRIEAAFEETLAEVELLVPYCEGGALARAARGRRRPRADRARGRRPGPRQGPGRRAAPLRRSRRRLGWRPWSCRSRASTPTATLPSRAHEGDAGLDLYACEAAHIGPGRALERRHRDRGRDPGRARGPGAAAVRAGEASTGSPWSTAPGLIDAGYRGEVRVLLLNTDPAETFRVEPGDRIAQL